MASPIRARPVDGSRFLAEACPAGGPRRYKTPAMATTASHARKAGVSDEAVRAKTGKTWPQWFKLLDARGARRMKHAEIAEMLHDELGVPPWWSQMVTVGYERVRGKRV